MSVEWMVIRGSGLVAYLLLSGATIWGLLMSTKVLGSAVKAKGVAWFHESLAIGALVATVVHMVALSLDEFIDFDAYDLFVPGAAGWRPYAVALGTFAFYGMVVVSMSFYVKKVIGQAAWRAIHYLSFGIFGAALFHGVLAGTDSSHPAVFAGYAATGAVVVLLVAVRVATAGAAPIRSGRVADALRRQAAAGAGDPASHPRPIRPTATEASPVRSVAAESG